MAQCTALRKSLPHSSVSGNGSNNFLRNVGTSLLSSLPEGGNNNFLRHIGTYLHSLLTEFGSNSFATVFSERLVTICILYCQKIEATVFPEKLAPIYFIHCEKRETSGFSETFVPVCILQCQNMETAVSTEKLAHIYNVIRHQIAESSNLNTASEAYRSITKNLHDLRKRITQRGRHLLEKRRVDQLVGKFPALYWNQVFITSFTTAHRSSLWRVKKI
jgi:hypothetical protein